ncbi:MAG: tetratricopeptide repeat protein [Flavobacteriales bacterium]|nr:tetratricopeptide repeat protein [Flavobacteriales bacterium]
MKKILLTVAFVSSIFAFGQKEEIESAKKIINDNPQQAENLLNKVEKLITQETDPTLVNEFNYNKGVLALSNNNVLESAQYFAKVTDFEQNGYYEGKSTETKNKKYYFSKKEADKAEQNGEISKVKHKTVAPIYTELIRSSLQTKASEINTEAAQAYQAKNYKEAGDKFSELHFVLKALNAEDPIYYYYSASAYYNADEKDKAIKILNDLIDMGFTGVTTTYVATNKSTKTDITLKDKAQFELVKLNPDYENFRTETTPSVEGNIYHLIAVAYSDKEDYDNAIAYCEKGLTKVPNHQLLQDLQGTLYYKSGQTDKFVESLKKKVQLNPKDDTAYYNLGVMLSKDENTYDEAKTYFEKAIEINPSYTDAYVNLASLTIKPDDKLVKQINSLSSTSKDIQKRKALYAQRQNLFKEALPYLLKAYELNKEDIAVVSALKGAYSILENDAKYEEFKEKATQLRKN